MGVGTIIASAIAIVLLIVTAYVLIGGTLATAKTAILAQRAVADAESEKMHTRIEILNASANTGAQLAFIEVKNTGSEIVGEFGHVEVYLLQGGAPYTYTNVSLPYNWTYRITPDLIHPKLLDPDEVANITVPYDPVPGDPAWVKISTANGIFDSAYLT